MANEIIKKFETQLNGYLQTITTLVEKQDLTAEQFMGMAVNQVKRNPKLLKVWQNNPASVLSSILTCAEFGLSPTSQLGEAWLIAYGSECQFQLGYQGLVKLMYRNPEVMNISAECVYEKDQFEYELGLSPNLSHKPFSGDRGKLTDVYCIVKLRGQEPIFKVMSVGELIEIQELSKAGNRSVWFSKTDPQKWMLKKTVFKQLCKLLPKQLNVQKAVAYDNIIEDGGTITLDSESGKPIVVDKKPITYSSTFQKALQAEKKEEYNEYSQTHTAHRDNEIPKDIVDGREPLGKWAEKEIVIKEETTESEPKKEQSQPEQSKIDLIDELYDDNENEELIENQSTNGVLFEGELDEAPVSPKSDKSKKKGLDKLSDKEIEEALEKVEKQVKDKKK